MARSCTALLVTWRSGPHQLEQAHQQADTAAVLRALHTQKGLAATVGACALAATLRALARRQADTPGLEPADVCQQLRVAVQRAQSELTLLLQRYDASTLPACPTVPRHGRTRLIIRAANGAARLIPQQRSYARSA